MAANNNDMKFDDNFVDLIHPINSTNPEIMLGSAPINPLFQMIDSERYIQSLENKLKKLKGGKVREPTGKEIIKSLERSKEDSFRRIDQNREDYVSNFTPNSSEIDQSYSALERKLHPERIAIDPEELVLLLRESNKECITDSQSSPTEQRSHPPNVSEINSVENEQTSQGILTSVLTSNSQVVQLSNEPELEKDLSENSLGEG